MKKENFDTLLESVKQADVILKDQEIERLRGLLREAYDGRSESMSVGLCYRIGQYLNHSTTVQPEAVPPVVNIPFNLPPGTAMYWACTKHGPYVAAFCPCCEAERAADKSTGS